MAVIDYIDGANRLIYLRQGVTEFHPVDDVYREARALRRTTESLRSFNNFVTSKGNEPKGGGKATPRFAILMEGTKIIPYDETGLLTVTGEVITDNADVDSTTVITTSLINKKDVAYVPPAAEIVYIEVSQIAIEMTFDGKVYLDVNNGEAGTGEYVGTMARPSNNLTDVLAIADRYNISSIHLAGTLILDQDVSGKEFVSWKNGKIDLNSQPCMATSFRELKLYGIQHVGSVILVFDCRIGNLQNILGVFDYCKFTSAIPLAVQSGQTSMSGCVAQIVGFDLISLDLLAGNVELEIRTLSAGLRLLNMANENDFVTAGFNSGILQLDSTCTNGNVYGGGAFQFVDNSAVGCSVHIEGKNLSQDKIVDIATAVLDETA